MPQLRCGRWETCAAGPREMGDMRGGAALGVAQRNPSVLMNRWGALGSPSADHCTT